MDWADGEHTKGERPAERELQPTHHASIATKEEIEYLLRDPLRCREGMARWAEDVTIRPYLQHPDWQVLYREATPLHRGFDFVAKHVPTGQVVVVEMKMSAKVGRISTYLKPTRTKGRQMSLSWIRSTVEEIRTSHPAAYHEILNALQDGLLRRQLAVANHTKRPRGWLSASLGRMGMKGFQEEDFRSTPGFG